MGAAQVDRGAPRGMVATMQPFHAIPRPTHPPLVGHLPEWLGKKNAQSVLDTLLRYANECGGLVRVPLGPARMLLVSDPDAIAEVLNAEDANFKGWPYRLTRVVLDNVLLLNGEPWARHRSAYRRALRDCDVGAAGERALEPFVAGVRGRDDETIQLDEAVKMLVADCVCQLLCSVPYPRTLEPHRARVQYELAAVGIDLSCQPWAYLSPYRWTAMRRSVGAMREFFLSRVAARTQPGRSHDVLDGFLELAARGEYPSDPHALRDGLVNFFFTAHDVLTASASFCLYLLASHPEVQDEVRAALSNPPDDLDQVEPLARVVRESLRLYPGYPLFSRRTRAPLTVSGHRVPAGTDVLISPWVLHRLERHWPDAERFDPERWRDRTSRAVGPGPRGAYMPFGGGHRSCIAFALAFPLIQQIVARIVREFRLRAVPGHTLELVYWGSVSAANGMPVSIQALLSSRASEMSNAGSSPSATSP